MQNKEKSRSWFCVWNNPQETYTDISDDAPGIAERALACWVDGHNTRVGAVAYCISADGLIHLHMVLEDSNMSRFSAVKKAYPQAHIEPTKGNKEQAEDYIQKKGRFTEKGEQVVYIARYGEIKAGQGQRKDLEVIQDYLEQGYTPNQIMALNLSYRRYEKIIKADFFDRRRKTTPKFRDVKVYYHVGDSGTGKSYTAIHLMEKYGEDEVYTLTDYESGGFDNYCGQKILVLDEFRGHMRFQQLLLITDGYKNEFHSRYTNITGLWNEVHITSVIPPESVYEKMVADMSMRQIDTYGQLKRRIDFMVFHYKQDGNYKTYEQPMTEYVDLNGLREKATGSAFLPASAEDMEIFK